MSEHVDEDEFVETPTAFPGLKVVRVYKETVEKVKKGHPEIFLREDGEGLILKAVSQPTSVQVKTHSTDNDTFVMVSKDINHKGNPLYIPVKEVEQNSGRVITAYFRRRALTGHTVLWEQKAELSGNGKRDG